MIVPFNYGIKQVTGLSKVKLYKETFNQLKKEWEEQKNNTDSTYYEPLSKRSKQYTDYLHPTALSDHTYLSRRSGIDDITRFVATDEDGRERVIFTPGSSNENALSYANGRIYWSEYESDLRWQNRSFSVVKEYDINTGKRRKLSRKSRYFSSFEG